MNILTSLFFLFSLTGAHAFAASTKVPQLQKVLESLRKGPGFHARLVKRVHEGVQDKDSESSGEIYFSKGKMRMELTKPEKILMVFDGRFAWQEQEFDDGESKHAIVTKMKANSLKKGSAVLAVLLGDGKLFRNFALFRQSGKGNVWHFELKPRNKKITEVTLLKLDLKGKRLKAVAYDDDLENRVSFEFDDLKEEKVPNGKFHYEPPKGAEVTSL